jgi:plastocyanin
LTVVGVAIGVALAGCGGGSKSTSTPSTSTPGANPTAPPASAGTSLSLAADPNGGLKFDKTALAAKAGSVTIAFTNSSPVPHNLTISRGSGGPQIGATPTLSGGSKTLKVTLQPGTYTFFCSVPGHAAAGMMGTLTVS